MKWGSRPPFQRNVRAFALCRWPLAIVVKQPKDGGLADEIFKPSFGSNVILSRSEREQP